MRDNDVLTTCLGLITSILLLLVVGTLVDGWALSVIWNWFIPTLFKLTPLTLWQAIGVSMVFELFTRNNKKAKEKSDSDAKTAGQVVVASLVEVITVPVLSVFIAWIVLQFAF